MTASSHEEPQTPYLALAKTGLDVASKIVGVFWSISLFFGGLIWLLYFYSIRFMPEMDLSASVAILIAAALTGAFLLLLLALLMSPGLFFAWQLKDGPLSNWGSIHWFALPLLLVSLLFTLGNLLHDRFKSTMGEIPWVLIVAAVAALIIPIMFLLRWWRKDRREAKRYVMGFGGAAFVWIILLAFVFFPVPFRLENYVPLSIVFVVNVLCSYAYSQHSQQPSSLASRWGAVALYVLAILSYGGFADFSGQVMESYKFGNFTASSVVLDKDGCDIARKHGLKEDSACHFSDVKIHSRVGSTYYVGKDGIAFTMPAQEVLSWSWQPRGG